MRLPLLAGTLAVSASRSGGPTSGAPAPVPSSFGAAPLISGVFMEAGCTTHGNKDWPPSRYETELDSMAAVGIDTIITICSALKQETTYPTTIPGYRMSNPALPRLLDAAQARNLRVIVGLELPYPSSNLPNRTANATYDRQLGHSSSAIAAEIYSLYKTRRSLAGFYLPVEFDAGPNPLQWNNLEAIAYEYLAPLTSSIKSLNSSLLTVTSPGVASWRQYPGDFSPWEYGSWWERALGVAKDLDVVAAQDSVGVDYNSPNDVAAYMSVLRFVCENAGREAWANVELFAGYGSSSAGPSLRWTSDPQRVISQVRNEAALVHKVVAFYWEGYLSPNPSIGPDGASGANSTWIASCKLMYETLIEYRQVYIQSKGGFAAGTPYYSCTITKAGTCVVEHQGVQ